MATGFKKTLNLCLLAAFVSCAGPSGPPEIRWVPFEPNVLDLARSQGRPVILYFSADWCAPCQQLRQFTFSHEAVVEATRPFLTVQVDLTDYDSAEAERLRSRFRVTGVPEVSFLDGSGSEIAEIRVLGFVEPDAFLRRVQFALERAASLPVPIQLDR